MTHCYVSATNSNFRLSSAFLNFVSIVSFGLQVLVGLLKTYKINEENLNKMQKLNEWEANIYLLHNLSHLQFLYLSVHFNCHFASVEFKILSMTSILGKY